MADVYIWYVLCMPIKTYLYTVIGYIPYIHMGVCVNVCLLFKLHCYNV